MLQNSLVHILHSTHRARLLPFFFFPVLEQFPLLAASQWGSGEAEEKVNTHSVSLHSWKSRGSGESTSTLRLKKKEILLRNIHIYNSDVCLYLFVFQSPCLGENLLPVGRGYLCLRAYQVCHCYPVSQQNRSYHLTF